VSSGGAIDYRGAREAVERILNRGGDAEDVLRSVLEALSSRRISFARVQLAGSDGLTDGFAVGKCREGIAGRLRTLRDQLSRAGRRRSRVGGTGGDADLAARKVRSTFRV